jgi:hypothetical protein
MSSGLSGLAAATIPNARLGRHVEISDASTLGQTRQRLDSASLKLLQEVRPYWIPLHQIQLQPALGP